MRQHWNLWLKEALQLVQHEAITGETFQRQDPRQKASREPFASWKKGSMPIGWHLNAIAMPGLRWNPPFWDIWWDMSIGRTTHTVRERLAGSTPLERLREKRGGQAPRSYPFGTVGFLKPIHPSKWPGQRLVLCHFLGMRYVTGGGSLGYPFFVDAEGYREVIKGHSFKLKESLQYDVKSFFPLLAGVRPQDFPEPRLEAPQAEQALPPPDFPPELDPPVLPRNEVSPQPIADGAEGMDVDAGEVGEGPEPMTIDRVRVQKGKDLRRKKGMRGWTTLFFKHRLMCGTCFVWKSLVVFSLLVRERTIHLLADFQQRQVSRRRTPALKAFHWASCNLNKVCSKVSWPLMEYTTRCNSRNHNSGARLSPFMAFP